MTSFVDLDRLALATAQRLRLRLLGQLGLVSPLVLGGCSIGEPETSEEGGVTTNMSSSSATASATTTEESGSMDEGDDASTDTGMVKLDVPPPDMSCTMEYVDPLQVGELFPGCELTLPDGVEWAETLEVCVERPDAGCDSICGEVVDKLCMGMEVCIWPEIWDICGVYEDPEAGTCCSVFALEQLPPVGRPFIVDAEARLAAPSSGAASLAEAAAHWYETARGEHASIAAFARFVASLQRVGAPASLVAEALRAAADEVRHAETALALAEDFAGRSLGFGPLRVDGALAARGETQHAASLGPCAADVVPKTCSLGPDPRAGEHLAQAVEAAVLEGCVGETLAAHEAASVAACVDDPALAGALEQIAEDELRHAALAWRFVAWAVGQDPRLRSTVRAALARAGRELDRPSSAVFGVGMLAHGCPPQALRARWRASAHAQLVEPCAAALLRV